MKRSLDEPDYTAHRLIREVRFVRATKLRDAIRALLIGLGVEDNSALQIANVVSNRQDLKKSERAPTLIQAFTHARNRLSMRDLDLEFAGRVIDAWSAFDIEHGSPVEDLC